jgi:hypothetical protein
MITECGSFGGMKTGRRNRSTGINPSSVPLCTPQIPHDRTRLYMPLQRIPFRPKFVLFSCVSIIQITVDLLNDDFLIAKIVYREVLLGLVNNKIKSMWKKQS